MISKNNHTSCVSCRGLMRCLFVTSKMGRSFTSSSNSSRRTRLCRTPTQELLPVGAGCIAVSSTPKSIPWCNKNKNRLEESTSKRTITNTKAPTGMRHFRSQPFRTNWVTKEIFGDGSSLWKITYSIWYQITDGKVIITQIVMVAQTWWVHVQ